MSSTTLASGPMLHILNAALAMMQELEKELWEKYGVGINPQYSNYGVPDQCKEGQAFMLMQSYHDEIVRKQKHLALLNEHGIEEAMSQLLAAVV